MHELSLAENVRGIIEDAAREQGFSRVRTVWLEIGQLSCVEREAMHFCFDAAMQDSVAAGARLEIVETPGRGKCTQCGHEAQIATLYEPCPQCGSYAMQVTAGDAMRVTELEVE
ncbi:MAG: hydrogenase maturation nickel metallochaperone HypA [Gallionellales bacterium GWA2_60_18]|nr:MAG: hydrogenase maturation nickel metallochaperone HypA [Gallionellales bacterium GWA2_60_18]